MVYKRILNGKASKYYYMDFEFKGDRVFKSTKQTTKREAEKVEKCERDRLLRLAGEISDDKATRPKLVEVMEELFSEKWIGTADELKVRSRLERCLKYIDVTYFDEVDLAAVTRLRAKLKRIYGLSDSTANRHMANFKTYLRLAAKFGYLKGVPYVEIVSEKGLNRQKTFTEIELTAIYQEFGRLYPDYQSLVEFLNETGMRPGEALRLTFERHINLRQETVTLFSDDTKNSMPRTLRLTNRALEILKERKTQYPHRPFPYKPYWLSYRFAKVREALGIDDKEFVPYALRHSCASRLINSGVPRFDVQQWMGHTNPTTTEKYLHHDPNRFEAVVAVLNKKTVRVG